MNLVISHVLENAIYEGEERERQMRARDLALKLNEKHVPKTIKCCSLVSLLRRTSCGRKSPTHTSTPQALRGPRAWPST
jgi:hypothetical protein